MENIDETLTPLQHLMSIEDDEFVKMYDNDYISVELMYYLSSLELELNN